MTMKRFAFATSCLALVVFASLGAWANAQLTVSKSFVGGFGFTNTGSVIDVWLTGTATQCGHANCVEGAGGLDDGHGNLGPGRYWMWLAGGTPTLTATGSAGSGNYSASMGGSTLYLTFELGPQGNGSQGFVNGLVTLSSLTGGNTQTPTFAGIFTTTSSSLNMSALWPAGIPTGIDFTVNLSPKTSFGPVPNGPIVDAFVSSGEVPSVPEPGTLAMMGTGIVGLAGLLRRKIF